MPSEDSKPLRRAEVEDEEEADEKQSLGSILEAHKKKSANASAVSAKSRPKEAKLKKEELPDDENDIGKPIKASLSSGSRSKVKKEENEDDDDNVDDDKPLAKRNNSKPGKEPKKRKKTKEEEEEKKVDKAAEKKKKREKKVYDLPGQKREPPEERDPLRIFYETLYKCNPASEMAQFWMMESGLLSRDEAKKVYDKKQKKSHQLKFSFPAKVVATVKRNTQSVSVEKKLVSSVSSIKRRTKQPKAASSLPKKQSIEDGSSEDDIVLANKKTSLASNKKKTPRQSNKRKKKKSEDESSEDESDDDFELYLDKGKRMTEKQRVA